MGLRGAPPARLHRDGAGMIAAQRRPTLRPPLPRIAAAAHHLHGLGEGVLLEFIAELATAHGADVLERLEQYRGVQPARPVTPGVDRPAAASESQPDHAVRTLCRRFALPGARARLVAELAGLGGDAP